MASGRALRSTLEVISHWRPGERYGIHCCVLMYVWFLVIKKRQESVSDSSEKGQIVLKSSTFCLFCTFLSLWFLLDKPPRGFASFYVRAEKCYYILCTVADPTAG